MKNFWTVSFSLYGIALSSLLTCYDSKLRTHITNDKKIETACRVSFNYELLDCAKPHDVSEYQVSAGQFDVAKILFIPGTINFPICVRQELTLDCFCQTHGCNLKAEPYLNISYATRDEDRLALKCVIDRCSMTNCSLPIPYSFAETTEKSSNHPFLFSVLPLLAYLI